jgi:hypothetical protein
LNQLAIAAHAVIAGLSLLAGGLGYALQGFGCFYRNPQQIGAPCADGEQLVAFAELFVETAAVLYTIWGIGLLIRRLMKADRGS